MRSFPCVPLLAALFGAATFVGAQQTAAAAPTLPAAPTKAVSVRLGKIYLNPDVHSTVVGDLRPGNDVAILEQSHGFAHVFVQATGWIPDRGLVLLTDPNGAEVVFGAAAALERRAESTGGGAAIARDAGRLYYRIYDDFPASPRAGEALYRAADIGWQLDVRDLPVATDPSERRFPDTDLLRRVESKFSGTEWAARAAYTLLVTHFTCGEWLQKPKCVDKEADVYRDYLKKYPASPLYAQALYDLTYREAAGASVWAAEGPHRDQGKAAARREAALADAAVLRQRFPNTDWSAQAALLTYQLQQGISVYVKDAE
ncbi:MAG: tetratricopeptide repeat protein [Terriglobales bacterium]